ncbi:MAG: ribonuclease domain-containing protein [Nocardioidaceae bacterium]
MKDRRAVLSLLVALVAALTLWWSQAGGTAQDSPAYQAGSSVSAHVSPPGQDGQPHVAAADLPAQARQTLRTIEDGGPFPYTQDGTVFGNYEHHLPDRPRGYYTEYTVDTPGSADRGARRIVVGRDGDFYYTEDHYNSFSRIIR